MRRRPQMMANRLVAFIKKHSRAKSRIFAAPSVVNLDEPPTTQEFINWDKTKKVVSIEWNGSDFTIGFVA